MRCGKETLQTRAGIALPAANPASRARPWQVGRAFEVLREILAPETAVVFGRAALRPDERITVTTLGAADPGGVDMATCVIIGSPETRVIARPGKADLVYSPRYFAGAKA